MEEAYDIRKGNTNSDSDYENRIRPIEFNQFKGQEKLIDNLKIFVKAAKMRESRARLGA